LKTTQPTRRIAGHGWVTFVERNGVPICWIGNFLEIFMAITLTELAAKQIKDIIKQQELPSDKTKLRVGVKGGGCSGFSYLLDLTEEAAAETDEELESQGVPILIDSKSLLYLDGTEIDFKDDVIQSGFVFKNPNATSSCGCGSSFSA
jgi:iron-sulfur cluster assembly protein